MVGLSGLSEMNSFDSCSHAYKFITTFSYVFHFISFIEKVSALLVLEDTVIPRYLRERGFRTCMRYQNMQILKAHSWFSSICKCRSHGYRGLPILVYVIYLLFLLISLKTSAQIVNSSLLFFSLSLSLILSLKPIHLLKQIKKDLKKKKNIDTNSSTTCLSL